ncbi:MULTISPECIES: hypothetical protein [Streptomyces]|uniref:hypothetical protein n=1 Tax=Streptomyces TaxID=1883 RepID=UPI002E2913EC|nr:hypothetical protein [Streptomyces sp. NBC_01429]
MAAKKKPTTEAQTGWRKTLHQAGKHWKAVADGLVLANRIATKVNAALADCRKIAAEWNRIKTAFSDAFAPDTA